MRRVHCRDCNAEIWWGETAAGRKMPINVWTTATGNVVALDPEADTPLVRVLVKGEQVDPDERRYVAHFTTCSSRRPRRRPTKKEEPREQAPGLSDGQEALPLG